VVKKAIALISDGIDSPVACHLALEQGYDVIALTYDTSPFSEPVNLDVTKRLIMHLAELHGQPIKLYVLKHGPNLQKIISSLSANSRSYVCVLCKRAMMKLANEVADEEGADVIITGENLGQVASQTLDNMILISKASPRHVVRPLLCMDKLEIEQIAKDIGTYDISVEGAAGCKAVPPHPQTRAKGVIVEELERDIELVFELE
jgi:thiamine biosynthesis protein ThiI